MWLVCLGTSRSARSVSHPAGQRPHNSSVETRLARFAAPTPSSNPRKKCSSPDGSWRDRGVWRNRQVCHLLLGACQPGHLFFQSTFDLITSFYFHTDPASSQDQCKCFTCKKSRVDKIHVNYGIVIFILNCLFCLQFFFHFQRHVPTEIPKEKLNMTLLYLIRLYHLPNNTCLRISMERTQTQHH